MKDQPWLQEFRQRRSVQQEWLEWFHSTLPEELRASIVNVVHQGTELTLLATSAPWSSRVRFALEALMPQLKARAPDIVKVSVRVAPAGRARSKN